MKKYVYVIVIALLLFTGTSCADYKLPIPTPSPEPTKIPNITPEPTPVIDEGYTLRLDQVVEIRQKDYNFSCKSILVEFYVPSDFLKEEILAHANKYIEEMKAQDKELVSLVLDYYEDIWDYDNITGGRYLDSCVATLSWAPYGTIDNMHNVPVGDYSTHTLDFEYAPLDKEYELNEHEKMLYEALQTYAIEQLGKPIHSIYSVEDEKRYASRYLYDYVAEQYGVPVEEVMGASIKVTFRRMFPECIGVVEPPAEE